MKKNSETPTLEQLLASVEHAGRDARRQQQLAEMIERMAAEEAAQKSAHRRTVRMWTARVAVAATVTLFVTTSVWHWNQNAQSVQPLVAEAPLVRPTVVPLPKTAPAMPNHAAPVVHIPTAKANVQPALETHEQSEPISFEEMNEVLMPESIAPEADDQLADLQPEAGTVSIMPEPAMPESQALAQSEPAPQASTRRRGIFSFLQAEPSMMEGTTLSFTLL